jgi:mono/diheme cytochrome c family protein
MRRTLRWTGRIALGLGVLTALAVVSIYAISSWQLSETFEVPLERLALDVPIGDPDALAEGQRLAAITGCHACHGTELAGQVYIDIPNVVRLVAPNLMQIAANASDAELVRTVRHGIKRNGTSVLGMPSIGLRHLTDEDLAAIIAYIRARPMAPPPEIDTAHHFLVRLGLVTGQFDLAAVEVRDGVERMPPPDRNDPMQLGAYVAQIACAECHGSDLAGLPHFPSPSLSVVQRYSRENFDTLMAAGLVPGTRNIGLMTRVAHERFEDLTAAEVDGLYRYLSAETD